MTTRATGQTGSKTWAASVWVAVGGRVMYDAMITDEQGRMEYTKWTAGQAPRTMDQEIYTDITRAIKAADKAAVAKMVKPAAHRGLCPKCHTYCDGDCAVNH